ncbi:hypothetical protein E2C01_050899 [Portunus trituberculatus]|uniref:Uncharacterized protein n=1 Tax=Portunus trituberculatus TaxID=210409 RepID=A0A5B7GA63_PORTR|nr:hypothetical protein [Portunus trituberculatus]
MINKLLEDQTPFKMLYCKLIADVVQHGGPALMNDTQVASKTRRKAQPQQREFDNIKSKKCMRHCSINKINSPDTLANHYVA